MIEKTDAELVAITQAGDNEAFGLLIKRYQMQAKSLAMRFVANEDAAQDIVQEADAQFEVVEEKQA